MNLSFSRDSTSFHADSRNSAPHSLTKKIHSRRRFTLTKKIHMRKEDSLSQRKFTLAKKIVSKTVPYIPQNHVPNEPSKPKLVLKTLINYFKYCKILYSYIPTKQSHKLNNES